jgi:hypothetical protein
MTCVWRFSKVQPARSSKRNQNAWFASTSIPAAFNSVTNLNATHPLSKVYEQVRLSLTALRLLPQPVRTRIAFMPSVSAGKWLTAKGCWFRDKEHGLQFKANAFPRIGETDHSVLFGQRLSFFSPVSYLCIIGRRIGVHRQLPKRGRKKRWPPSLRLC